MQGQLLCGEFQADDTSENQAHACHTQRGGGLAHQEDAEDEGSYSAYACPDCIGRAHGQMFHGNRKQPKADDHGHQGNDARKGFGEAFGVFHGGSPDHLENSGENKINPIHRGVRLYFLELRFVTKD